MNRIILLCAFLQFDAVLSVGIPRITHDKSQKPIKEESPTRFTYDSMKEVRLYCNYGKWDPIVIQEGNPVFPQVKVTNVTSGNSPNITLTIHYDDMHFVKLLKVTCRGNRLKDEAMIIQQYTIANVNISNANTTVYERAKIKLQCLADGNPPPQYQWYKKINNGDFDTVQGGSRSTIYITMPVNMNTSTLYLCQARNARNKPDEWIKSSPLSVNSTVIPPPTIEVLTKPIVNTSGTVTYFETESITLRCFVPMPLPNDYELQVNHYEPIEDTVYEEPTVHFTKKTDKQSSLLTYTFNLQKFPRQITVFCHVTLLMVSAHKWTTKMTIIQLHKTNNVIIKGSPSQYAEKGHMVTLKCVADGNPLPEYRWFHNSRLISGAKESTYEYKMPENRFYEDQYTCGAKNKYNDKFKDSESVTVYTSPTIESLTPTTNKTSTIFAYFEAEKISLSCVMPSSSPIDIKLKAKLDFVYKTRNPFIKDNFTHTITGDNHNLTIHIFYNKEYFVPLINVNCKAIKSSDVEVSSSSVLIEQHYKTTRSIIKRPKQIDELEVKVGRQVDIQCVADGYPYPEIQWFNSTKPKTEPQQIASTASLKFTTHEKWLSKGKYFCGAKNQHNLGYINSSVLPVSTYWYVPIIEPITTPIEQTFDKFTYLETEKVTIRCRMPTSSYDVLSVQAVLQKTEEHSQFHSNFSRKITGGHDNKTIEISYWPKSFVPSIKLTCRATYSSGVAQYSSSIEIRQQFRTTAAFIKAQGQLDITEHINAAAGDVVTLRCFANGYPEPQIQWFNNTNSQRQEILNATQVAYKLPTPETYSSKGVYICGAKNDFNLDEYKYSDPMTVTATYISQPIIRPITMPIMTDETGKRLTYNETSDVSLVCGLPPSSAYIITLDVKVTAISGDIKTSNSTENGGNITLNLIYNEYSDDVLTVLCIAKLPSGQTKTSSIEIEQYYRTTDVHIIDCSSDIPDSSNVELEPKDNCELKCKANGNPKPHYQWFNVSNSIEPPLVDGDKNYYNLTMPASFSSKATYVCGAKNENNPDFKKSKPFTVTSWFIPLPTIESLTTAINITSKTFTYLDTETVNIRCSLPTAAPEYFKMNINIERWHSNNGRIKNVVKSENGPQDVILMIEYDLKERIVPIFSVSCVVNKPSWQRYKSSQVDIISYYSANRVLIEGSKDRIVEPGETVKLSCSAYGNPIPVFQWYSWINNTAFEIADAINATYQITFPSNRSSEQYICGAKNEFNVAFINSKPVTVSVKLPTPEPTKGGTAKHYSSWFLLLTMSIIQLLRNLSINET